MALRNIVGWVIASLLSPAACVDERQRPADVLEGNEGEGEGAPGPLSPFACGEDRYECRGNSECVDGVCRTPEGQREKWCTDIVFLEWAKHVFIPVDQRLGETDTEKNFRGTCVRSDLFDFRNLTIQGGERPFHWGSYEGDNALQLILDKSSTIDQREGNSFEELQWKAS